MGHEQAGSSCTITITHPHLDTHQEGAYVFIKVDESIAVELTKFVDGHATRVDTSNTPTKVDDSNTGADIVRA
jgi:hypothetical protein